MWFERSGRDSWGNLQIWSPVAHAHSVIYLERESDGHAWLFDSHHSDTHRVLIWYLHGTLLGMGGSWGDHLWGGYKDYIFEMVPALSAEEDLSSLAYLVVALHQIQEDILLGKLPGLEHVLVAVITLLSLLELQLYHPPFCNSWMVMCNQRSKSVVRGLLTSMFRIIQIRMKQNIQFQKIHNHPKMDCTKHPLLHDTKAPSESSRFG